MSKDPFVARFGELRARQSEAPSALGFARIARTCEQLWRLDAQRVNEQIVPYLRGALDAWPDEALLHPMFWLELWLEPQPPWFEAVTLVRVLDLSYQRGGDALAQRLVAMGQLWAPLRRLDLSGAGLGPQGAQALAGASLGALRELILGGVPLGPEGVEALCQAPWLSSLRELQLWSVTLSAPSAERLAQRLAASAALERLVVTRQMMGAHALGVLTSALGSRVCVV